MWTPVKIAQDDFFMKCTIATEEVKFVLYNLKESWCQRQQFDAALLTTKKLNKRVQYTADTVRSTLQHATPEEASWEKRDETAERTLKLKYRVSTRPFNFEWILRAQTAQEHNESMLLPLLKTVQGMSQQIEKLREIVRKKDIEITQYKTEGAILRRTTVATQPFDIPTYEAEFAETNALSASFLPVAQHFQTAFELISAPNEELKTATDGGAIKSEVEPKSESPKAAKEKQKNKKRKAFEMQQKHLASKLQAKKQKLVYESSQSQSLSLSQSSTEAVQVPAATSSAVAAKPTFDADLLAAEIMEFSTSLDVEPLLDDKKSQDLLAIQKALQNLEQQRIADMKRRSQDGSASGSESSKRVNLSRI